MFRASAGSGVSNHERTTENSHRDWRLAGDRRGHREVPATLQLYLDGKMEQFWLRDKEEGVIFLMSVDSVDEADRLLEALPLVRDGLLRFDLMPIGPLLPLGMLMKAK